MHIALKSLIAFCLLNSSAWAVEAVSTPTPTAAVAPTAVTQPQAKVPANTPKPLTAEQISKAKQQQDAKTKAFMQDQANRLKQLEHANLEALAQNQELQLKNDSLAVQIQVLQSERSAQMFLYGAMTLAVGVLLGFLISGYVYTKRRRQW